MGVKREEMGMGMQINWWEWEGMGIRITFALTCT